MDDLVVVSPDFGGVGRARSFAKRLDIPLVVVDKRRPKDNESEVLNIIGDVEGKKVLILDELIDTAGSLVKGANALVENGATKVYACCTHAIMSKQATALIADSPIEELVILDTIPLPAEKLLPKIKILSVAPLFAAIIRRIHEGDSISVLF